MDANEENINNNLNDNVNDNAKDNVDATTKKSIRSRARVGLNPNLIVFALIVFAICGTIIFKGVPYVSSTAKITNIITKFDFKNLSTLTTQEYNYTYIGTYENSRNLSEFKLPNIDIPFTKKKIIYSCDGRITAGVDCEKIKIEEEKNATNRKLIIYMPTATVISNEKITDSLKKYDEHLNIFNPFTFDDFTESEKVMKDYGLSKALDYGLIEKANEQAKNLITTFIKEITPYVDIEIIVVDNMSTESDTVNN